MSAGPEAKGNAGDLPRCLGARWVDLGEIVDSETYRLRDIANVPEAAESLIRHGQLTAVELRATANGLQLIAGHRRLEAAKMLGRRRILGRVHDGLSDDDALFLALADDLDRRPWAAQERDTLRARLKARGELASKVAALLARADSMMPEGEAELAGDVGDDEVDADTMASFVRDRLADACNDLSTLYDLWSDLDEGRRADLIECVKYLKDMYPFLVASEREDE